MTAYLITCQGIDECSWPDPCSDGGDSCGGEDCCPVPEEFTASIAPAPKRTFPSRGQLFVNGVFIADWVSVAAIRAKYRKRKNNRKREYSK